MRVEVSRTDTDIGRRVLVLTSHMCLSAHAKTQVHIIIFSTINKKSEIKANILLQIFILLVQGLITLKREL